MRSQHWHLRLLFTALTVLALHSTVAQQPFALQHSLFPLPTGTQTGTQQGDSVAIEGNLAVVGVPYADHGAVDSGVVKVYDAATGVLRHTLFNPRPGPGAFGNAVAISGTRVVVAAYLDNSTATAGGIVHAYDLASATPTVPVATLLNPAPASSDYFGQAVAISGTRVVVGSIRNGSGITAGDAYIYDLAGSTPAVPIFTLNNPTPLDIEYFGSAVAISGDWVIVGAYGERTVTFYSGAAYVYNLAGANPTLPRFTLPNPTPAINEYFGVSVAMAGNLAVVGARFDSTAAPSSGSAYVYDLAGGTPTEPELTLTRPNAQGVESFGVSVAISDRRVIVAAHRDNVGATNSGAAFVFDLASPVPTVPVLTLTNPSAAPQDIFGRQVAISGARVIVGAPMDDTVAMDAGSAYLYNVTNSSPSVPVATLNSPSFSAGGELFGSAVAISGSLITVGAYGDDTGATNAGRVYVFDVSSGTPTMPSLVISNPAAARDDGFGYAVAMAGTRVVVGAHLDDAGAIDAGTVYVYELGGATPTQPFLTLTNPTPQQGDYFGYSVAISEAKIVVGAHFDDTTVLNSGSAYVYDLNSPTPGTPWMTLKKTNAVVADLFGFSVAISGTRVAIGAPVEDTGAPNTGQAYVFELTNAVPTSPVAIFNNPTPEFDDRFGTSVAIAGPLVAVGAPRDNTGASHTGSAYVFDISGMAPTTPIHTFTNPLPAANSAFGTSLGLSATRVVVGMTNGSAAYLYDLNSTTPRLPAAKLTNPAGPPGNGLGWTVAMDGLTTVTGAPFDATYSTNSGAAYVFGISQPSLQAVAGLAQIVLSWPTNQSGFVLQTTDSLISPQWTNAPSGIMNPVSLPTSEASRFYRLFRP